jgi:hypothetical protein
MKHEGGAVLFSLVVAALIICLAKSDKAFHIFGELE